MLGMQPMADAKKGRPRKREEGNERAFSVRVDRKLYKILRLLSAAQTKSLNDVAAEALREWVARQPDYRTYEKLAEKAISAEGDED